MVSRDLVPMLYESAALVDVQIINPLRIDPAAAYWASWVGIGPLLRIDRTPKAACVGSPAFDPERTCGVRGSPLALSAPCYWAVVYAHAIDA
jgi:hypothetical protein